MKRYWTGACAVLLLLSGCVGVDYVGQQFPEIEEDEPVIIYRQNADYPASDYKVIGRAIFTAPDGYAPIELDEKMEDTARAYGANAIKVVSYERTAVGSSYIQPSTSPRQNAASQGVTGVANDGSALYTDSFGNQVDMSGYRVARYELIAKTLFLIKRNRYEKLHQESEVIRKENEKRPTMFDPSSDPDAPVEITPETMSAPATPAAENTAAK